jgi:hypothetical protein
MKKVLAVLFGVALAGAVWFYWHGHSRPKAPRERQLVSAKPIYFRVVFGKDRANSMLGVIDESRGSGTGYDVAYLDENLNGDLSDDAAKKFRRAGKGSRTGEFEPRIEFEGPFDGAKRARYALDFYELGRPAAKAAGRDRMYFFWNMKVDGWDYFFINGTMRLYSSAAAALDGAPVCLAGECSWKIASAHRDGQVVISAALQDGNGCNLRSVNGPAKEAQPKLTLTGGGREVQAQKMEFG